MPFTPDEWEDLPSKLTPIIAAALRKLGSQYGAVMADLEGEIGAAIMADHLESAGPLYDAVRTLIIDTISDLAGTGDPRSPIGFDPVTKNPVLLIERPA